MLLLLQLTWNIWSWNCNFSVDVLDYFVPVLVANEFFSFDKDIRTSFSLLFLDVCEFQLIKRLLPTLSNSFLDGVFVSKVKRQSFQKDAQMFVCEKLWILQVDFKKLRRNLTQINLLNQFVIFYLFNLTIWSVLTSWLVLRLDTLFRIGREF